MASIVFKNNKVLIHKWIAALITWFFFSSQEGESEGGVYDVREGENKSQKKILPLLTCDSIDYLLYLLFVFVCVLHGSWVTCIYMSIYTQKKKKTST